MQKIIIIINSVYIALFKNTLYKVPRQNKAGGRRIKHMNVKFQRTNEINGIYR